MDRSTPSQSSSRPKPVRASHQLISNIRNEEQKMLLIAEVAKRHIAAASDVIAQCKRVLAQSRKLCNQAEPDRRRKSA